MKNLYETPYNEQDHFRTRESVKGTEKSYIVGVNGAVTESPAATRTALPCLSNNNSTEGIDTESEKITSPQYKAVWGVRQNVKYWCDLFGIENMAFLTITVRKNITDKKEYSRRYKSLYNYLMASGIDTILLKGDEPQSRGAWHSHCLSYMGEDVRTGFDFDSFKMSNQLAQIMRDENKAKGGKPEDWLKNAPKVQRQLYEKATKRYTRSASPKLRRAWKIIRKGAKAAGFGRCELVPVKHGKALGDYIGKYISKGFASVSPETKGMRKINYCRRIRRKVGSQFSWVNGGSAEWRKNLSACAKYYGIREDNEARKNKKGKWIKPDRDYQRMAKVFGERWAYNYSDEITYIGRRERWLQAEGRDKWHRFKQREARRKYDELHRGRFHYKMSVIEAWTILDYLHENVRSRTISQPALVTRMN